MHCVQHTFTFSYCWVLASAEAYQLRSKRSHLPVSNLEHSVQFRKNISFKVEAATLMGLGSHCRDFLGDRLCSQSSASLPKPRHQFCCSTASQFTWFGVWGQERASYSALITCANAMAEIGQIHAQIFIKAQRPRVYTGSAQKKLLLMERYAWWAQRGHCWQ